MGLITICVLGTAAAIAYLASKICMYNRGEVLLIGPVAIPPNDEEVPPKYEDINN